MAERAISPDNFPAAGGIDTPAAGLTYEEILAINERTGQKVSSLLANQQDPALNETIFRQLLEQAKTTGTVSNLTQLTPEQAKIVFDAAQARAKDINAMREKAIATGKVDSLIGLSAVDAKHILTNADYFQTKNYRENINKTNTSYSGSDMVAAINITLPNGSKYQRVIGELQTLTYSIYMDKRPVRSIGNVNAKDYVFGPRTIAGSLVFAVFDKHFATKIFDEIKTTGAIENYNLIMDELPPFDITITFANEYGDTSHKSIYGVRIVSEGMTLSINDIYTENTYQFVATDIDYLQQSAGAFNGAIKKTQPETTPTETPKNPLPPILPPPKTETKQSVNLYYDVDQMSIEQLESHLQTKKTELIEAENNNNIALVRALESHIISIQNAIDSKRRG